MIAPAARDRNACPLTLAISSGKGGVGKSQLAASLAAVMGRADRRVLLVDVDVGVGDLAILTATSPRTDLRGVLAGSVEASEALTPIECMGGWVDLLPAPSPGPRGGDLGPSEQLAMVDIVGRVGMNYDVVIVDTGAGVTANPMLFAAASDRILLVTTPEPTAIFDAYAAIKVLHQAHRVSSVELVVNGVTSRNDGKRTYRRLLSRRRSCRTCWAARATCR